MPLQVSKREWREISATTGRGMPNALDRYPALRGATVIVQGQAIEVLGIDALFPSTHVWVSYEGGKKTGMRADKLAAALAPN